MGLFEDLFAGLDLTGKKTSKNKLDIVSQALIQAVSKELENLDPESPEAKSRLDFISKIQSGSDTANTAVEQKAIKNKDAKIQEKIDTAKRELAILKARNKDTGTKEQEVKDLTKQLSTPSTPTPTPTPASTPTPGALVTDKANPAVTSTLTSNKGGYVGSTFVPPTPTAKSSTTGFKKETVISTPATKAAADAKQVTDFQARYGVQAALINSDPSLKTLFEQARKENWDANRFKAEFLNTDWAKTHAETWQASERARLSAPGTYADSYNRMRTLIAQTAVGQGIALSPDQLGAEAAVDKPHDRTGNIVEWALDQSWGKGLDATALKTHIAELGKVNLALPGGSAFNYASELKQYAFDNGLSNLTLSGGADYYSQAAQSILLGKSDVNTWKADILKTTKQNYGAFAAQLDAGMTMRSIAAPYINTLANLLEIAPDQVNLGDSTGYGKMVTDALRGTDPANPKPIALYDFEKTVKANPAWGYTNNARDTVLGGVGGLLKTLGKVS